MSQLMSEAKWREKNTQMIHKIHDAAVEGGGRVFAAVLAVLMFPEESVEPDFGRKFF